MPDAYAERFFGVGAARHHCTTRLEMGALDGIRIVPYTPDARAFCVGSWLRGAKAMHVAKGSAFARVLGQRAHMPALQDVLLSGFLAPALEKQALLAVYEDTYCGWGAWANNALVWGYVPRELRGRGIWRLLRKRAVELGYCEEKKASGASR